jgi:hypothetical protein
MITPPILPDKSPSELAETLIIEKNSLRRFFAGLTATTFGVLVALHPDNFSSQACGWVYVSAVVANAISVLFFISSLFGRYRGIISDGINLQNHLTAVMRGEDYSPNVGKRGKRFKYYSICGIIFYVSAILASCTYIVLKVSQI